MSRSGYIDDYDDEPWRLICWRGAVASAIRGKRGQKLLRELLAALDAMPVKRLITDEIKNSRGEVCALGALDPTATSYEAEELAKHFGIARALAAEIVYMNDEYDWATAGETPEQRWARMRAWVEQQILPEVVDDQS